MGKDSRIISTLGITSEDLQEFLLLRLWIEIGLGMSTTDRINRRTTSGWLNRLKSSFDWSNNAGRCEA